ncbi:MAG: gamma-glutamyl-phosphate reductase, partial [Selenomonadaceae bacterium]|nr:gamma-glutamyl-phosphate reductase [Selenomonadaceae bacterium]
MDIKAEILKKAKEAKAASRAMSILPTDAKNEALLAMADALEKRAELVLAENAKDLEDARQKGLRRSYLDRLMLNEGRIAKMAEGLRQTAS